MMASSLEETNLDTETHSRGRGSTGTEVRVALSLAKGQTLCWSLGREPGPAPPRSQTAGLWSHGRIGPCCFRLPVGGDSATVAPGCHGWARLSDSILASAAVSFPLQGTVPAVPRGGHRVQKVGHSTRLSGSRQVTDKNWAEERSVCSTGSCRALGREQAAAASSGSTPAGHWGSRCRVSVPHCPCSRAGDV